MSNPANTAQKGWGPFAVLRRAKNVKNASDPERNALLDEAERIEAWCAWLVLGAIVLEAVLWISPLCPFLFKVGNFFADAAVGLGIYGEMLFGHVVGDILKIRLTDAVKRAGNLEKEAADARERVAQIEQVTSWRHVSPEQKDEIVTALRGSMQDVNLLIEYQNGDPEAWSYAFEIASLFTEVGIAAIRRIANSHEQPVFGVRISGAQGIDLTAILDEFAKASIPMHPIENMDLSTHLPRNEVAPNLYIFVGPKSPPALAGWEMTAIMRTSKSNTRDSGT